MDSRSDAKGLDAQAARVNRLTSWLIVLALSFVLPLCLCGVLVMLVLLGIIAEPETVIEQILRFLSGG